MSKKYFARINGEQQGPFTLDRLAEAGVTPDTYVWCKGMDDWMKARHDAEICRYFRQRLFDRMHPGIAGTSEAGQEAYKEVMDNLDSVPPRFRGIVEKDGSPVGPPHEDRPDYSIPPRNRMIESILVTLFCSILGIVAIYFSYAAQKAWQRGEGEEAYDLARRAKMWLGISFFIGIIGAAVIFRTFL